MKQIKKLSEDELSNLLHHIVEAGNILNPDGLKLTELDCEKDKAVIELQMMSIQVFHEIKSRTSVRHQLAKERIRKHLMNQEPDWTEEDADDFIDDTIVIMRGMDSLDEIEEIWNIEFGCELDDLTDLMGW